MLNLFVYGTLMKAANSKSLSDLGGVFISQATTAGELFNVGWFPALTKTDDEGVVCGELWSVPEQSFEELDRYEGYQEDDIDNSLYLKEEHAVETEKGEERALMYIFNQDTDRLPKYTSGNFLMRG